MEDMKITKKQFYTGLINLVNTGRLYFEDKDGVEVEITGEQLVEFSSREIAQLDAKLEKAKERAAMKRAEGDELMATVLSALTPEPQTIADIVTQIGDDEISSAKVIYRLNQLVKNGQAAKSTVTIPGSEGSKSRQLATYSLAC